jgi:hypothetical protein
MDIFNKAFAPPSGLETDLFVIFPTDVSYYKSDYETVIKCKEPLRLWSQSTWPEASFTAEENKHDLQLHVEDNLTHAAYGYMIYSLDRQQCFGSIYVNPVAPVIANYQLSEDERQRISQLDARIDFWTNSESEDPNRIPRLDLELMTAMKRWFVDEWKIQVGFAARRGMTARADIYAQLGLLLIADVTKTEADGSSVSLLLFN